MVTAAVAVLLMRTEPNPDARPRLVLGAAMVALPVLGLWHLWAGSPDTPVGRAHAAGFIGFAIGGPLSEGLTAWICAPLLFIGALFGLLLLTGTTIREVPDDAAVHVRHPDVRLRRLRATTYYDDDPDDAKTVSPKTFPTVTTTTRRPTATTKPQAWPSGTLAGRRRTTARQCRSPPSRAAAVVAPKPPAKQDTWCSTGSSRAPTRCRR